MSDPIDQAIKASNLQGNTAQLEVPQSKQERIRKLPIIKAPELIAREAEAATQHATADADNSKLKIKEESDVEIKKGIFTGNKQEYPKVEKYIDMCSKINEVRNERISTSSKNVKTSKKAFTFPIKKWQPRYATEYIV